MPAVHVGLTLHNINPGYVPEHNVAEVHTSVQVSYHRLSHMKATGKLWPQVSLKSESANWIISGEIFVM